MKTEEWAVSMNRLQASFKRSIPGQDSARGWHAARYPVAMASLPTFHTVCGWDLAGALMCAHAAADTRERSDRLAEAIVESICVDDPITASALGPSANDPLYRRCRREIGLPDDRLIRLSDERADVYEAGEVAVVFETDAVSMSAPNVQSLQVQDVPGLRALGTERSTPLVASGQALAANQLAN